MTPRHTNKLIAETSPYLLQHAHNPVNWFPWGEEAIALAKKENKPILVSIGYSACHWCHVMERESFENEEVAKIMNEYFINIKIDREERPDLDQIYMDAVQAMSGQGGWPLNVFLTPDTKPFYGGTYFPPIRAYNRASWTEVLQGVYDAFQNRSDEIIAQANSLTEHLQNANNFGIAKEVAKSSVKESAEKSDLANISASNFTNENVLQIASTLIGNADHQWGGFGKAPKFPQTYCNQYLLRYAHYFNHEESLQTALLSLDKMMQGGIYDQLGGGFARYSTDAEWLAPHFEKMLYDNALLVSVYSEAYQLTHSKKYLQIVNETMQFVVREMYDESSGAFYSAIDADSEGKEGKFYVWSKQEIEKIVGADAELFCAFYDVIEGGNWEHENILWVKKNIASFCEERGLDLLQTEQKLSEAKAKLLEIRSSRIRPQLDDKTLLSWNALMNWACSKAFAASGNVFYRELAEKNMNFLLEAFKTKPSAGSTQLTGFYHTWKNGQAKYPAFLEDMSFLIQALILLQETTANLRWLDLAKELMELTINKFGDLSSPYFFFTSSDQQDVIVRKKEIYDGALPSGNALMASSLYKLSLYLDRPDWAERAFKMVEGVQEMIKRYPVSFGCWAAVYLELTTGTEEISLLGEEYKSMLNSVLNIYIPHKIIMASASAQPSYPLLKDKIVAGQSAYFLCKNYACQKPVSSLGEFKKLIIRA